MPLRASRRFEVLLTKLNGHICPADQGIFNWHHNNQLIGIITCFVDDIIWSETQYFRKTVIEKLKTTFKTESESLEAFIYLGLHIKHNANFSIDTDRTNSVSKCATPAQYWILQPDLIKPCLTKSSNTTSPKNHTSRFLKIHSILEYYSDTSFNNLPNGRSQWGQIILSQTK